MGKTKQRVEVGENPKIEFGAMLKECTAMGIIPYKYNLKRDGADIQKKFAILNLPSEILSTLQACQNRFTSGRNLSHIIRLLEREGAERNFAIAYIQYAPTFDNQDDIVTQDNITHVLGGEGYDTTIFWTFAPYLFNVLLQKGIDEGTAIRKILLWAKDGASAGDVDPITHKQLWTDVHLPGLEFINKQYVLDKNPKHISHKFTEQEAIRVANLLMSENEK